VLELRGITKAFGGVHALRGADLRVSRPGEIHALIGENGSGKSTLLGVLSGQLRPDRGEVTLDGKPHTLRSPADAIALGIVTVSQEIALAPGLTVAENVLLGRRLVRGRLGIDWGATRDSSVAILSLLGLDYDPRWKVGDLRPDQQQMVEIARALSMNARVLILDEPTSSLDGSEVEALFDAIRQVRDHGVAVIFVSHRLDELFALCDEVTVLRDGKTEARGTMAAFTRDALIAAMVGEERARRPSAREASASAEERLETAGTMLEVAGLSCSGCEAVDLTVRAGEIVGLAGLVGSGRSELLSALFGASAIDQGTMRLAGVPYAPSTPRDAIDAGVGLVPPDRKRQGVVLTMSVGRNLMLVDSAIPLTARGWRCPARSGRRGSSNASRRRCD
jgi:ABC-type sugar transport system ATPase subunit